MPYPSEQVDDRDFVELVASLCARPAMYVHPPTLPTVCAYLCGYDQAHAGGLLIGLHQWLVTKRRDGNNLHWIGLVELSLPDGPYIHGVTNEGQAINGLGSLLGEFFGFRRSNGLTRIFGDYARWLKKQEAAMRRACPPRRPGSR